MYRTLLACGLLALVGGPARGADGPPAASLGLTAAAFESAVAEHAKKGFRPARVSAAVPDKEPRFAVVWAKGGDADGPRAYPALTAKEFEAAAADLAGKGFRPADVCGYELPAGLRFAAVWEKAPKDAPARVARAGLTADEYRKAYADLANAGYRPVRLAGFAVGKEVRYTTVWEKEVKGGPAWHARRDLTGPLYQEVFDDQLARKLRPVCVAGYTADGEERFAGVWEAFTSPDWQARHGLDEKTFEATAADLTRRGFRAEQVGCHAVGGKLRYSGVWVRE